MKRKFIGITSIFLLIPLFLQVNQIAVFYFLFDLNQRGISDSVCEKKVSYCNGKCYLNKQIKKATDEETKSSKSTIPSKSKIIELVGSDYIIKENLSSKTSFVPNLKFIYFTSEILPLIYTASIDKPPQS